MQFTLFFKNKTKQQVLFFLFLGVLSFATYWQSLGFTFAKDDWGLLWGSLYDLSIYPFYAIHPATPFEFWILSHVFGTNPIFWQISGIFLRVCIAYLVGKVVYNSTNSSFASFLAAAIFACCYGGLESTTYVSGHAASVSLVFLLLGFNTLILILKGKSHQLFSAIIYTSVGFVLDPGRALPIIIVIPLYYLLFAKKVQGKKIRNKKYMATALVGLALVFIWWYITQSPGSQFALFITRVSSNPGFFFKKLYLLGNYFASIGNLLTGWVIPNVQDAQNTGVYSRILARISFAIFCLAIGGLWYGIKKKNISLKVISFFTLWMYIWYVPDWLFEPRAPMAGSHRYLLLSSVGLVVCIAYAISRIRNKNIAIGVLAFVLMLNVYTVNRILAYQSTYRSTVAFDAIWKTVNREVSTRQDLYIFVFTGNEPYKSLTVGLTSGIPFAFLRTITQQQYIPFLLNDPEQITHLLCVSDVVEPGRTRKIILEGRVPLSHVYAWNIVSPTHIISVSEKEREFLKAYAQKHQCVL